MIDTVVLTIPKDMFRILDPECFTPNAEPYLNPYGFKGQSLAKTVQNSSRDDVLNGNYKPRLTILNRLISGGRQVQLKIEFSAPKLLFGNNFDELAEKDFPKLLQTLNSKLRGMGVFVTPENLMRATVTAIHYSKNVVLDDFTSTSMIISELAKIDVNLRLDVSESKYRNAGHCLHYHANSFEVVFYDKLKDLEQASKSDKRAIEDDNYCQTNIFDAISKLKPFEVFRMEVRLGNATKMKQLFKKLGLKANLYFNEIFSKELSQKVLLHFWQQVDAGISLFKIDAKSPFDLLRAIRKNNPNMHPTKLLKLVGSIILIQEAGYRPLREALGIRSKNAKIWYSLKKELRSVDNLKVADKYNSILKVKQALNAFIPLRLADYDIQF